MPDVPTQAQTAAPDQAIDLDAELAGLDALELGDRRPRRDLGHRLWQATWPKVAAVGLAVFIWQLIVWAKWWPEYALPGPAAVFQQLRIDLAEGTFSAAVSITMQRAFLGYALALVLGVAVGSIVSRNRVLRSAVGSMITGLQTMPSIAWFPLAILLFKGGEGAIFFVVVLGAAPANANGLIAGTDTVPPILLRAGRALGATRWTLYRYVVLPASMPSFLGGLKQGWAFAWRSLMAGELLVIVAGQPSIGVMMQNARDLADTASLIAVMIVIFVIGIAIDALFFGTAQRALRERWGLVDNTP